MKKNKFRKIILIVSLITCFIFISATAVFAIAFKEIKLDETKLISFNNGIIIESADDSTPKLHNTTRTITELADLPNYVKDAFIAVEDKNFYSHNGYDFKRIIKSLIINIATNSKAQGASTISQQLVKNALLTNEKTYSRKFKELILSIKIEKQFSKDEIIEMYLNTIYFGNNAYGIENASQSYFNKSASNLSINEACCLAGIIKAPNLYSPRTNYKKAIKRKNLVAKLMYKTKKITEQELSEILSQEIILSNNAPANNCYEKEAIYETCSLLNISERELINQQFKIKTFKHTAVQNSLIKSHNNVIDNANLQLDSLSIVAKNNGSVIAYYANSLYDLHNLKRQPASTLKPLAVYLPCFIHNILTPASRIMDEKINYNGFEPQNADKKFHGQVTVRDALSQSLNIPAVKALDYLGVIKSKNTLNDLGILISNSDLNLSLGLGATQNGIKLTDLTSAYITLATQGYYSSLSFVDKILDKNNKIIYSHEDFKSLVVEPESCFLINDILKDTVTNGTAKRLASLNLPIASKTGTAGTKNGNTDVYNIAYSTEHTILTWIADIKNIYLPSDMLSSAQPTEINKNILESLYSHHTPHDFKPESNIVRAAYDLTELKENKKLVKPTHNIERYIAYDYFKSNNQPYSEIKMPNTDLKIELSRAGANIYFNSNITHVYKLVRNSNFKKNIVAEFKQKTGLISFLDLEIFDFDEVEYYLLDEQNNIISDILTIKPKDFLINSLNNEFLSQKKKKWYI